MKASLDTIHRKAMLNYQAPLPAPKMYLCGFPKSGLHLAEMMVSGLCGRVSENNGWFGTNAWDTERKDLENVGLALGSIEHGRYMKGHMGYLQTIEMLLAALNIGLVFVYRDLRDVVVSQMHHVLSDDDALSHPDKEHYQRMSGPEEVMCAIIEGDDRFPGIFERWETFAPWITSQITHAMTYGEMLKSPRRCAVNFFQYAFEVAAKDADQNVKMYDTSVRDEVVDIMVDSMGVKNTTTYRKGKTGTWKEEFTHAVVDCFKKNDPGWLVRLGFEKDDEWQLPTDM